jgi:TRAP-type C4-dicarboxylate transport system permease small subunit
MAPLTFVGAALCTFTGTHIAVDIIKHVQKPLVQRVGRVIVALSMIVFGAVYFYTGWEFFSAALNSGEKGLDLGTPIAIPVFFLPLGMALVVLHAVAEMVRAIANSPPACEEFL